VHCPFCRHPDSRVVDSREADDGAAIRRFTTLETASLTVVKRSGATEPFSRVKVIDGVRKAFSGRPVDEDALARLGQQVEETVRASGTPEVPAHEIGMAILEPLSELDEVAYIRFASVYRNFTSLDDFVIEVAAMRASLSADPGAIPAAEALN
jgi:transcriptional repressor NrdR